jgi:crotonobetainyl-CoA:carnitine CoA-transferase CaiB-like acyl-CoA transferase
MEVFTRLDVCVEPVLTLPEMLAHPQTQARGLIVDVPKPDGSFQRQVGQGIKFSAGQSDYQQIGPKLGADTDAVLTAAGYTATEIESMRTEQVFG